MGTGIRSRSPGTTGHTWARGTRPVSVCHSYVAHRQDCRAQGYAAGQCMCTPHSLPPAQATQLDCGLDTGVPPTAPPSSHGQGPQGWGRNEPKAGLQLCSGQKTTQFLLFTPLSSRPVPPPPGSPLVLPSCPLGSSSHQLTDGQDRAPVWGRPQSQLEVQVIPSTWPVDEWSQVKVPYRLRQPRG